MANTKFYLDTRRSKPGKPAVLKIFIGQGNTISYVSLNVKLIPDTQWKGGEIISHPDKLIVRAYINEMKQKLDAHIIWLTREGKISR